MVFIGKMKQLLLHPISNNHVSSVLSIWSKFFIFSNLLFLLRHVAVLLYNLFKRGIILYYTLSTLNLCPHLEPSKRVPGSEDGKYLVLDDRLHRPSDPLKNDDSFIGPVLYISIGLVIVLLLIVSGIFCCLIRWDIWCNFLCIVFSGKSSGNFFLVYVHLGGGTLAWVEWISCHLLIPPTLHLTRSHRNGDPLYPSGFTTTGIR